MSKAEINTAGGNGAAGIPGAAADRAHCTATPKGTLLYDAIYLASNRKDEPGNRPQGDDHPDRWRGPGQRPQRSAEAIAAAQRSNVIVYVILIADTEFYGGFNMGYSGYSAAKKITEETGGRLINVGNNGKKLEAAFQQIQDELRTQYVASYTPSNAKLDGTFRHIAVECKDGGNDFKVQVRKGYFAPGGAAGDNSGN